MGEFDEVWRRLKALAASYPKGISRSAAEQEVAVLLHAGGFYRVPAEAFRFYVAEFERLTNELPSKRNNVENCCLR